MCKQSIFRFMTGMMALSLLVVTPALAQNRPQKDMRRGNPEVRIEQRVRVLDERLDLSEEQEVRLREILRERTEAMQQNMQAMRSNRDADRQERMEQMRGEMEKTDTAILAILNPEQQEHYKKHVTERRERRRPDARNRENRSFQRFSGERVTSHVDQLVNRLDSELDLSDAQEAQIRETLTQQMTETRNEIRSLNEKNRQEIREIVTKQAEETDAVIEGQITPEQLEKYRSLRTEMQERMKKRS